MAKKISAGLLPYRRTADSVEVFIVHPGGPIWAKRDADSWSIAKGEVEEGEDDLLEVAKREFKEETSFEWHEPFIELGSIKQKNGKVVHCWGFETDFDRAQMKSNTFTMEWPFKSGTMREFPEVDRGMWLSVREAKLKLIPEQEPFVDRLLEKLKR